MEIKEIFITLINATALVFSFSIFLYKIVYLLSDEKINFIKTFSLLYAVGAITSFIALSYLPICLAVVAWIYLYIQNFKILHNTLSCILAMALFFLIMAIENALLAFGVKIPYEEAIKLRHTIFYNIYNSIVFILCSLIAVWIITAIFKDKEYANIENKYKNTYNVKIILFIGITFVFFAVIISTFWFVGRLDPNNAKKYTVFTVIIAFFMILFVIYSVCSTLELISLKEKEVKIQHAKEMTELYKTEIQSMYNNMRDFKHDYMKIYSSMSILIEQGNLDTIKKFFSSEITPLQNEILNNTSINTGILQLDDNIVQGLVYSYMLKAKNIDIDFSVDIGEQIPVSKALSSLELSRILGIFIDNAFEAASESSKPHVTLCAVRNADYVRYIITNTYAVAPNMTNLFMRGYSSKGDTRGNGLAIAKKLADKNSNVFINAKLEGECFYMSIYLYTTDTNVNHNHFKQL